MRYRNLRKYKYQLIDDETVQTEIDHNVATKFITIQEGLLTVKSGYAWDGATFAFDTATILRGSLFHDALYQLMREGELNRDKYRPIADLLLKKICLEDGMWKVRAEWVYFAVKTFARRSTKPTKDNKVITI